MIGIYFTRCKNNATQYIATQNVFDIEVEEEWKPSSTELLQWGDQAGILFGDGGEAEIEGDDLDPG